MTQHLKLTAADAAMYALVMAHLGTGTYSLPRKSQA